jgi:hypothetical protein
MTKATSAEQYKLVSSYETVRRMLLDQRYADRLDKPLAYWALPNDRRLPLALLDRKLCDLLSHPYDVISSTPGVGQKKIGAMIKLLLRATKEETPDIPYGIAELVEEGPSELGFNLGIDGFDASLVSESQWVRWKETIHRHHVEGEVLGRLAPALSRVPTVIWHTPLSFYMPYSLAEIRQLKTHGEKRVSVVLEVFHLVHRILQSSDSMGHLTLKLIPKFAIDVDNWINSVLETDALPGEDELRKNLVMPLLAQAKVDVGDGVYKLAEGRLGVKAKPQSVRAQSRRLGVTRARVYQLLDECGKAMAVRWPEGRALLAKLAEKYDAAGIPAEQRPLLEATRELFFPSRFIEDVDAGLSDADMEVGTESEA